MDSRFHSFAAIEQYFNSVQLIKRPACLIFVYAFGLGLFACADPVPEQEPVKKDYIRKIEGVDEPLSPEAIQKGEVLIAYSDCYTCHQKDKRSKGPAFESIAARYPANKGYISLLALKIIQGGSGAWGHPVMTPHPTLTEEDAKLMATYILSLKTGN